VNRKEVEAKLAAAETRRRQALARAQENAERLAELESERAARLGEAKIAERGIADFEAQLEELRLQLAEVELAEARSELRHATHERDAALARAADAARQLMVGIEGIADARSKLNSAHERLLALDAEAPKVLAPEPPVMDEHWRALAPLVEAALGIQLESELVEAAVRNPNSRAVESLPAHLQELVRQKQRELRRRTIQARITEAP
jgi:hypothetical protein